MGSTHPSKLLMSQEEVGIAAFFFVRGTSGAKTEDFARSGRPSPSLDFVVRWCLYNDLLSLEVIILLNYGSHIKNTIRFS